MPNRPLDDPWEDANAVMPGAWRVERVEDLMIDGPPNEFVATAVSIGRLRTGTVHAYGDSPDHALRALRDRLIVRRDGRENSDAE